MEVVREHAGQASGSHDVPVEENLSIIIHEEVRSRPSNNILQKLKSFEEVTAAMADRSQESKQRIQKAPFMLRDKEDFNKYFEPRVISIGPLHHCNPKFEFAEKIKLKLAAQFINEHRLDKEELYMKIETKIENLRNCYYEEATKCYKDEDLAWMFFVDGCAVLHYIDCVTSAQNDNGKKLKEMNIKNDHRAFAGQDLFLLENQLPYQVLMLLMSSIVDSENLRKSINKFIDENSMLPQEKQEQEQQRGGEPTHLLDLLRKRLLRETPKDSSFKARQRRLEKYCKNCFPKGKGKTIRNWHSFRNVKELKAAGIRLRPSKTSFLTDISFSVCLIATLKLPPLIVDDSTAPKFLNLIAYEMCPDFVNDFEVTSYVCFLDSLIDQAEDVKELRKKHILHNALGSDDEVATLFNQITSDLVPNPETYDTVKECIQNHCDKRWTTWMAQAYHDHFSSPWTILAFVGALIALVLSFIQTLNSVLPDKVCCNITRIITNAST